jgi:flagellar motility protein MotE (MotC chaperone)
MSLASLSAKIRLLPVTLAAAALAFGVHAGELVQKMQSKTVSAASRAANKPANTPVAKPYIAAQPTRTAIELAQEISAKSAGADESKRQFELRERLLETSEKRIDAKLAQLKVAQAQSDSFSAGGRGTANAQFASLVKVYEVMKPKDAARIFEKLDMPVQLAVATAMKERNMAALMSEMSPEAARKLTMEMAAQAQLTGYTSRQGRSYVAR